MSDHGEALEDRSSAGNRLYSPSVQRNAPAIVEAWQSLLPEASSVLEIASGTGEHGARLCAAFPPLRWQPSDPDAASRRSIEDWSTDIPDGRMAPPLDLDVCQPGWWAAAGGPYDTVFCANMIHIAPWSAAEGLMAGAAALLSDSTKRSAALALYGPFSRRGAMVESNHRFNAALKARDPACGVRDLDDHVQPLAARFGLALRAVHEMPANNLFVVFEPN